MTTTYNYSDSVRKTLMFAVIMFAILIVTIPGAIYLFIKTRRAKLVLDDDGFTVSGLGGTSRWTYQDIERLGTLSVRVTGGGPLVKMNGGATAVNLVGKTKGGKTLKFMLSRFDQWEAILEHVQQATKLPVEEVRAGAVGVAWPKVPSGGR